MSGHPGRGVEKHDIEKHEIEKRDRRWRLAMWIGAALLLSLPAVAMRFTGEVNWTAEDFIVFGAMLAAACGAVEFGAWLSRNRAYRAAFFVAVATGFMLVWITLAVGFIGDEGNPANLLFAGVLAVGITGAAIARFRAPGMARAMIATACAQALIVPVAWLLDGALVAFLCLCFVAPWLLSAVLFRIAARGSASVR